MALREHPRRYFSYRFTGVNAKTSEYLRSLTNGLQTQQLEFPLWSAIRTLPQSRYIKQSGVQLGKEDVWCYRDCHAFMLTKNYNGLEGHSQRYNLKGITSNGFLNMRTVFREDFLKDSTLITPVFWGILNQEDSYTNVTASVADMHLNVEIMPSVSAVTLPNDCNENNYPRLSFPESTNVLLDYRTYDDHELFMMPPSWYQDMNMSYSRNANRLDNNTGYFRYDLKSTSTTTHMTFDFHTTSRAEIHNLQRFFYRCKGCWKSFYVPTWTSDIELAKDEAAGNTMIQGKFPYYYRYYASNKNRRLAIVFYKNGTVEIIKIAGWTLGDNGKTSKILLDKALTKPLIRSEIRMISFLCKVRLVNDSMETEYETREVANISFELVEVDD